MNLLDEQAWKREFDHVEEKQKQREGWDGKEPVIKTTITIPFNTYSIKDDSNEK